MVCLRTAVNGATLIATMMRLPSLMEVNRLSTLRSQTRRYQESCPQNQSETMTCVLLSVTSLLMVLPTLTCLKTTLLYAFKTTSRRRSIKHSMPVAHKKMSCIASALMQIRISTLRAMISPMVLKPICAFRLALKLLIYPESR